MVIRNMSEKLNIFEDAISNLIIETFSTVEEIDEAIKWAYTSTFIGMLERAKEYLCEE